MGKLTTMILILSMFSAIYIFVRSIYSLNISTSSKLFSFVGVFAFSNSFTIARELSRYGIEISLVETRIVTFIFLSFVFFTLVLILRDILIFLCYVLSKLLNKKLSIASVLSSNFTTLCALICVISISGHGVYSAIKVPNIKDITITIPNLPENLKGFEIVQLTDLHIGSAFDHVWLEKVVAKTNAIGADVIVVTGDMVDNYVSEVADEVQPLKDLKAKYGVYYSYGNHEYYERPLEWKEYFEGMGLDLLINENVTHNIAGSNISIIGIGDPARGMQPLGMEVNNEVALKNVPEDSIKILLSHQPKAARHNASFDYELQLSGHTHGGQAFFLQSLMAKENDGYVSGHYNVNDMQLYVSNGTGLWGGIPFRLFVDSEITRITLQ